MKHHEHTNNLYTIRQLTFFTFIRYLARQNWVTRRSENLSWNNHIHLLVIPMSHRFLSCISCVKSLKLERYSGFRCLWNAPCQDKKRWLIAITSKWIWLFQLRFSLLPVTQFWRARYLMKAKNVSCLMVYKLFVCSWCFIS